MKIKKATKRSNRPKVARKVSKEQTYTQKQLEDIVAAAISSILQKAPSEASASTVPDASANDLIKPTQFLDELTDDEVLFYSTDYYDELQDKKASKQRIEE